MTIPGLVPAIVVGAALIALWIDVRWSSLAPRRLGVRVLQVAVALVVAQYVAPRLVASLLGDDGSMVLGVAALLLIFLPSLVYVFLSGIWVLRLLQRALRSY